MLTYIFILHLKGIFSLLAGVIILVTCPKNTLRFPPIFLFTIMSKDTIHYSHNNNNVSNKIFNLFSIAGTCKK